jgi:hypothetical protein
MARKKVNKICTECEHSAVARGLCSAHYSTWRNRQQVVVRPAGMHEVLGVKLPARRNFEWLGDLQTSVAQMNDAPEE